MSLLQLIGKSQGVRESPWPGGTVAVFRPSILLSPFCLTLAWKYSFAEKCRSQVLCSLGGYQ